MGLLEAYNYYSYELADERTKDWFLSGSPVHFILVTCAYLYFVLGCGPRYMKDKQPYSLRGFIRFYNVFQIVSNALIVYQAFENGWYEDPFIYCYPGADMSWNPQALKWAKICWYVYMLKYIDYTETVVFVLRKKTRQISTLHVVHHISAAAAAYLNIKYWAQGISTTVGVINCSVHVVMYTFYLAATFGPDVQKQLQPIKPIITIIQIVQLVALTVWATQAIILPQCYEYAPSAITIIVVLSVNIVLFCKFYRENYGVNKKKVK